MQCSCLQKTAFLFFSPFFPFIFLISLSFLTQKNHSDFRSDIQIHTSFWSNFYFS